MIDGLRIPSHWCWATFGEVADVASDLVNPTLTPNAIHIAPNHIESWTGRLLPFATIAEDRVTSAKHRFRVGQILYSKIRPYLAKAVFATFDGLCSADMYPVDSRIDTKYLLHWILTPWFTGVTARNQGRTILPKINRDALNRLPVPVAPFREQVQISAKIEELFSDLDAGVAALKRAKANLKRYRAAVLKAAVEGKLTAEWRAKHPKTEPASKLLERILVERRKKWEGDQLAKFTAAGKEPPKDWKAKYVEPLSPDSNDLLELPKGWCWASVDQVSEVQGGIQKQPKRQPVLNAFPFLRVANVLRNRLDLSEVHKIELFGNELERLRLCPDDMLIVEGNGSKTEIGRSAIWGGEIDNCVHQNHIIRVRFLAGTSRYLNAYWNSPVGNSRVTEQAASTSGLYTLSVAKVCDLPVPLPPESEQQQIVAEVEERLSQIAATEQQIEANLLRASRLRQSILKQAFEGKLVAHDPKDEPAGVLLEHLRSYKTPHETKGKASVKKQRRRSPSTSTITNYSTREL